MKALIEGTRICQIVNDDEIFQVSDGFNWVNIPEDVSTFDIYVDGKVIEYVSEKEQADRLAGL
ncbi:MAG: hypothetical protein AAGU75_16435 [Bacillota bacterium]|jgi:hypothetical protein